MLVTEERERVGRTSRNSHVCTACLLSLSGPICPSIYQGSAPWGAALGRPSGQSGPASVLLCLGGSSGPVLAPMALNKGVVVPVPKAP